MKNTSATILGCLAIILWSSQIGVSRSSSESLGTLTTAFLTTLAATCLSFLLAFIKDRSLSSLKNISYRYILVCGGLFVVYGTLLYCAIGWADSREQLLEIGLINYLWPSLTVLVSIPVLKKKLSLQILLGFLFSLLGVFTAASGSLDLSFAKFLSKLSAHPVPYIFSFLAAIAWAFYSNFSKLLAEEAKGDGAIAVFFLFLSVSLYTLMVFSSEQGHLSWTGIYEVSYVGITTAIAYLFWDIGVRKGNFSFITAFSYITPILFIVFSSSYLNVSTDTSLWIGVLLVVVGAVLSGTSSKK